MSAQTPVIDLDYGPKPSYECEPGEAPLICESCKGKCLAHYEGAAGAQLCLDCWREWSRMEFLREAAGDDAFEAAAEY